MFYRANVRTDEAVLVFERQSEDGWSVAVTLGFQAGVLVVGELKVFPTPKLGYSKAGSETELDWRLDTPDTPGGAALVEALRKSRLTAPEAGTWPADTEAIAAAPAGGISSTLLRRLDIGAVIGEAKAVAESTVELWEKREPGSTGPWPARLADAPRRPGRAGRDNYFYAQVAEWFVTLIQQRVKGPVRHIAKERIVSEHTVRDWLAEARKRGLLTKAAPGRTEGQLTEKARALLALEEGRNGQHPQED